MEEATINTTEMVEQMEPGSESGCSADGLVRIRVRVMGITPLLMNRMSIETLLSLGHPGRKPPKGRAVTISPKEQAKQRGYFLEDGSAYIPAEWLMSCLVGAGVFVRLDGKRQLSTGTSSLVPGLLTIEDITFPLHAPDGWETDIRQGCNSNAGKGGTAIAVIRPKFNRWAFETTVVLDTNQISEEQCRQLFDIGLSRIGLGSFRPAKKGIFGRSMLTKWEVLDGRTDH